MLREHLIQLVMLAAAALALTCAAMLQKPIESERRRLKLLTVTADEKFTKDPRIALLQIAPGGLRAPLLNYLWIRSQQLKQDGKFFDAMQLRELICDLTPHVPDVWAYHAWDMAWNISVATHTPDERWMWVTNAIRLLRDRGLYHNPDALILYKELAWIFFEKIGQYNDEMHMTYKRRWAGLMHRLLGAPPFSDSAKDAIEAFRQIAEAPDSRDELLADAAAADFVERLNRCGIRLDAAFLEYYNRLSGDPSVSPLEWMAQEPAEKEKQIAALMRSGEYAAGRARVLAFVRRKILRQQYHMNPQLMLELMERYGPLDWRHVNSHAIYWATLGLRRAEGLNLSEINALNTDRTFLGSLKSLTRTGQLYLTPNPDDPDEPFLDWGPDWRFVEPTHREYLVAGRTLVGPTGRLDDDEVNKLRGGHITYLSNVIQQLYIGGREELARKYYDKIKNDLKPTGDVYKLDLYDFVREKRRQSGVLTKEMTRALLFGALRSAYRALAGGNQADYARYRAFARRAYREHVKAVAELPRLKPPPFSRMERDFMVTMLVHPRAVGLHVPLLVKARLYNALSIERRQAVYPYIAEPLRRQCRAEEIDFNRAFPAPPESR